MIEMNLRQLSRFTQWNWEQQMRFHTSSAWSSGRARPFDFALVYRTKVKEESEEVDLKLNIQKIKIMASGSITSL